MLSLTRYWLMDLTCPQVYMTFQFSFSYIPLFTHDGGGWQDNNGPICLVAKFTTWSNTIVHLASIIHA